MSRGGYQLPFVESPWYHLIFVGEPQTEEETYNKQNNKQAILKINKKNNQDSVPIF